MPIVFVAVQHGFPGDRHNLLLRVRFFGNLIQIGLVGPLQAPARCAALTKERRGK
jgi:hypothetical protein